MVYFVKYCTRILVVWFFCCCLRVYALASLPTPAAHIHTTNQPIACTLMKTKILLQTKTFLGVEENVKVNMAKRRDDENQGANLKMGGSEHSSGKFAMSNYIQLLIG